MNRLMTSAAALALTATTAFAAGSGVDKLRDSVELRVNEYNSDVIVEMLTERQVKQIALVLNDSASTSSKTHRIEQIVEGTPAEMIHVTTSTKDVAEDPLRANVEHELAIRNYDVDASKLTDEQVSALNLTFNSSDSPSDMHAAVSSIVEGTAAEGEAEMLVFNLDMEPEPLRAAVGNELTSRGFEVDPMTLSDQQITELAGIFNTGNSPAEIESAVKSITGES
ncbi:hypothetical protein IV417_01005 [Alphaproteobacteria bacterium KMM 3653]|uniref:Uncharacterized protein n=1 Tax=Harenicola maris TaxID=2841044 RepID=A0AAP2CLW7_9RHOB|nr:hypothetical protein [Harenicola maris]